MHSRAEVHGPFIFGAHKTTNMNTITDIWRRKLNRLWDLCGPWTERPTPHRFRHTFARILLQKLGVTVRDVAELLGDTEELVRKHYAAWMPERQERLTKVLKDAFGDKPKPKLIAIPGGGVEQARVYPACRRFWNAVDGVGFLAPHPYLDDARIILYKLAHRFAAQSPYFRQLTNTGLKVRMAVRPCTCIAATSRAACVGLPDT
jgi:hypothetical protein